MGFKVMVSRSIFFDSYQAVSALAGLLPLFCSEREYHLSLLSDSLSLLMCSAVSTSYGTISSFAQLVRKPRYDSNTPAISFPSLSRLDNTASL